jgi:hypothetical protein
MKQGLIEKISKNKELPKTMLEVYRSLGYMNYKFGCSNTHINDYTNIFLIAKSLNGPDWNPEINENLKLFYPYFEWDNSSGRFVFYSTLKNKEYYYGNFPFGFKTKELAMYAGKTFIDQYIKWLIIPKNELKLIEEVDYQEIKTMSDVYRVNGITKLTTPPETKERYYEDLILVAKALNGNWKPDWNDKSKYKWYPYFQFSSVFRFSGTDSDFDCGLTDANVGSRLCFKNKQISEYAGKIFFEQYEKIMRF